MSAPIQSGHTLYPMCFLLIETGGIKYNEIGIKNNSTRKNLSRTAREGDLCLGDLNDNFLVV